MNDIFEQQKIYLTEEKEKKLAKFCALLKEYNEKFNLTSIKDDDEIYEKHFADSLKGEEFFFENRNRRPPLDNVNAMLSFAYTLLANECAAAFTAVGLDAYVGFLHTDRPGRTSLALDLMEELRAVYADRFVLTLINKKTIKPEHFVKKENGAVLMNDTGRKTMISAWQGRKRDKIKHPFLGDKIEWGLIPHVQALLLARLIRGDLDEYPVFLWK